MGNNKTIGLALVCADGRLHQEAVHYNRQLAEHLRVDLVDMVAVPGPDGLLKDGREADLTSVTAALKLLVGAHHPAAIAIAGHYNCAGNPVENARHDADVAAVAEHVKQSLGFAGPVITISTVRIADDNWSLKEVGRP